MAIDFPNSPAPGTNHTVDGKTWTFTDGKWALNVGVGGVQGPAGVAIQGTAPATTDVLWADTSDTGLVIVPAGGTTGQVLAKSSGTDYATTWATPVTSGDMALKADLASPAFTGTPTLPTGTVATTQTAGNSSTAIATTAFVGTAVANLVDSAPATLNTLDELALALGDDANFATTTATAIGLKAPLASPVLTGTPTAPTASTGTNTTQIATTAFVAEAIPVASLQMFAGAVTQTVSSGVVTTTAPSGWLLCNGNAVSRSTYSTLFASVSTTYGAGDGTTTFNLPDMRSRMPVGTGTGTGLTARTLAGTGGVETVTLTGAQSGVPAHSHANTVTNNTVSTGAGSAHTHIQDAHSHTAIDPYSNIGEPNWVRFGSNGPLFDIDGNTRSLTVTSATATNQNESAHTHSVTSNVTISNVNNAAANAASAHDNMSPYLGVNFIIKV